MGNPSRASAGQVGRGGPSPPIAGMTGRLPPRPWRPQPRRKGALAVLVEIARAVAWAGWLAALPHAALAQALPEEVQVGTFELKDYEFEWGRDGVLCPTCNYGAGNARLAYIDSGHTLWVGFVDPDNGYFYPPDGKGVLVDTNATTATEIGNGPEWLNSQLGSQLAYTRWTDGKPRTVPNLVLGFARAGGDAWVAGPVAGSQGRVLPIGTENSNAPNPLQSYQSFTLQSRTTSLFWRGVYPGAVEQPIPVTSTQAGVTRRWVPGTRDIIITVSASAVTPTARTATADQPPSWRQVFLYHTATATMEQLTFDNVNKYWAFMWTAPEFNNEKVFVAMVGGDRLQIYRNLPSDDGGMAWTVVKTITTPAATPYVSSPEPFVYKGRSWVFFSLSADPNGRNFTQPSLIAMSGILPETDDLRLLTSATEPMRARRDPEYFITANGPYIYYNRYFLETDSTPAISEGVFRVDTQLWQPGLDDELAEAEASAAGHRPR